MRMPDADTKADVLVEMLGEYLLARLGAKKNLSDLKDAFEAAQDALRAKMDAEKAAVRVVQHAMAARDEADQNLDAKVRNLYMAVESLYKNRKANPLHLKYFPNGLTAVTLAPLPDELIAVGKILALLATEERADIQGYQASIQEAAAALKTAMDAYSATDTAAGLAGDATRAQAIPWRDAYRKTYGELLARFPSDTAYAASFFKKAPKKPKKDGGDTPPLTTKPS